MLAHDTEIETGPDGSSVPVQALKPGDRVFDRLTGGLHEIVGIKSREAMFGRAPSRPCPEALHPVRLSRGGLDGIRPAADLVTSPAQRIFVDRTPGSRFASLDVETAQQQVARGKARVETCRSLRYYAVFTREACPISANGTLVLSYGVAG